MTESTLRFPVGVHADRAQPIVGTAGCARPLRIAFCTDNLGIGGSELNAVRTAERLDRSRFAVELVCLNDRGPLRARYEAAGIPIHVFPVPNLYGRAAIAQGLRLARWLAAREIDVVHCHDVYTNVFATFWARIARTPVIIASRRWWQDFPEARYRIANGLAYRLTTRVLANSPAVARALRDAERLPESRVVVVPNFVDESSFNPLTTGERARRLAAFGLGPHALVVGIVARLDPIKDHATLLTAVASLRARWPALRLLLVGDGPCRERLCTQARRLGIEDIVRFAGFQPNDPNPHALFDISVLCSLSEGFPNSIVEAMAAGRPVVATSVGGNTDAVRHLETGLLVPPADALELEKAIATLLSSPARREAMGLAAQRHARANYHAAHVIPSLEVLYEQLVEERAPRTARLRLRPRR